MKRIIILLSFAVFSLNALAKVPFKNKTFPFTVVYCLDGTSRAWTQEGLKIVSVSPPVLGRITFYEDKIIDFNYSESTVYKYQETQKGNWRTYSAPVMYYQGHKIGRCLGVCFTPDEIKVMFSMIFPDINHEEFAYVHLMEESDFWTLWNKHNVVGVKLFSQNSDYNMYENPQDLPKNHREVSNYFKEHYDYKDCHICRGTGTCKTCNGNGCCSNPYTSGQYKCPNCLRDSSGNNTGKCSTCQGTGKVYGFK